MFRKNKIKQNLQQWGDILFPLRGKLGVLVLNKELEGWRHPVTFKLFTRIIPKNLKGYKLGFILFY
jgi:hypothetical protein